MSIVLFIVLAFSMLFSIYNLFARPLTVYKEYLKSLPEDDRELSLPTYIWVTVILLLFTTVSTIGFALWALTTVVGLPLAAIVGLATAAFRLAYLARTSQLQFKFINGSLEIDYRGAWDLRSIDTNRLMERLNIAAASISSLYLVYLVLIVFQTR